MTLKKKIAAIVVSAAALVASGGALAGCSGGASIDGVYTASRFAFFTAYPGATYKQLTSAVQTLETYDDGTYAMTVITKSLSGDLEFDPADSGDPDIEGVNDRGQTMDVYYGTYTSTESDGFITFVLSAPTDIISSTAGTYISTLAWTDKMGQDAVGEGEEAITEEQYIEQFGYSQTTIVVDAANYTFTYVNDIGPVLRSGTTADMIGG